MKKVKAGKSKIHGNGLIADEPIRRGDVIELVHTIREIEPGVKKTTPTLLGRNYNHSEEPNSMNVIDGNNRYLVALKEIEVGGEITTDYRNNPDLEQPDSFTSNDNYVSFDYDDTLTTPEGFKLAKQMVKDGNNLYVITARDKMSPQMIERAEAAGIPKENIILAGSDEQKVKIVKENNISKHIDNKESVIKALGKTGKLFNPGEYPDLKADFIEMDLSDEELNQLKKGGFIIDQYPDGGIVEYNGYKYKQDQSGNWTFANSGAPVTDKLMIQKITYEGKPVGSSAVQGAPKPKPISTVTKQQQLETIRNSPVIADQRKANQLQDEIRNENIYFPKGEPAEDEPEGIEGVINSALGYPMAKAALSAEFATNEGQVDNYRHANAGRYTAEAIKDMTGNIPYLSDAAAIVGANALGLGHEVGAWFANNYDTRPWTSRLKESGEDMYNNFVGTTIGVSDMTPVEKTDKLLNLSYSNQLPDGYVKEPGAPRNVPNNMYFKKGPNDPGKYKPRYPDGGQPRPVQGMAKPLAPLAIREEQVKALKNSPKVADQKKYKAVQDEVKAIESIQKASKQLDELQKDALPQYEQPLTPQDWVWTLPMAGGSAMKSAGTAIADGVGALGTKAMPYLTGALETSLPFMKSIPGATVGNAIASGFATDAIVNRLPEGVTQLNNGQYIDATGNILTGVLDVAGAGMMSPIYQGAKSTASELARFLSTEDGLLSNTYKINPLAGKLNEYNRVVGQDAILDLQNSGLIRAGERGGVETNMGIRTSAYPSFGKGLPKQRYIDQTIQQGKTPYIISTNRPMGVSTLGRHGKGSTMLPIDETGKYMSAFPADEAKVFGAKPNWLHGYKEVPSELPGSPNTFKSSLGGMDMSRYEIKNPDYFTQLLNTYDSRALSAANKKFYKGLIDSVKKQKGIATERQYNELQRLKTGNFNFGKKGYSNGGSINQFENLRTDSKLNKFIR